MFEQQTQLWHSGSPSPPGSFFTASQRTLIHKSPNPKAIDPTWSFIPHRMFATRLTAGVATIGMRGPQMFFDLVQRMSAQQELPHHSFLGSGLATSLRLPLLRNRMEELLAFNREA